MKLEFPVEISDGLFGSNISNKNQPFILQTCRVKWDLSNTLLLKNDHNNKNVDNFYDKFINIENDLCQNLSYNSTKWFGTDLSFDKIKSMFVSSLKIPNKFNEPFKLQFNDINEELKVYDIKNRKKSLEDIQDNEITCLLHGKQLFITEDMVYVDWELIHVMIHKKKNKKLFIDQLSICDEQDEPVELFKSKKNVKDECRVKDDDSVDCSIIEENNELNDNDNDNESVKDDKEDEKLKIVLED